MTPTIWNGLNWDNQARLYVIHSNAINTDWKSAKGLTHIVIKLTASHPARVICHLSFNICVCKATIGTAHLLVLCKYSSDWHATKTSLFKLKSMVVFRYGCSRETTTFETGEHKASTAELLSTFGSAITPQEHRENQFLKTEAL